MSEGADEDWDAAVRAAVEAAPGAQRLADLLCLLDVGGVPVELLSTRAVRCFLIERDRAWLEMDPRPAAPLLTALADRGLVTITSGEEPVLSMPAGARELLRSRLVEPEVTGALLADALAELWPEFAAGSEPAQLVGNCIDVLGPVWYARLAGAQLRFTAWLPAVIEPRWQRLTRRLLIKSLGPRLAADHPAIFALRFEAAEFLGEAGDEPGAAAELDALAAELGELIGSGHRATLSTRVAAATWRTAAGPSPRTRESLRSLLADLNRLVPGEDWLVVQAREELAFCDGALGDPAGAAKQLQRLVDHQGLRHGFDHPQVMELRNSLVVVLDQVDPETAIKLAWELVADLSRVLGYFHLATLRQRRSLASMLQQAGCYAEGLEVAVDVLKDIEKVQDLDSVDALEIRVIHAVLVAENGEILRGIDLLEGVLLDQVRVLGAEHRSTLETRHQIAIWLVNGGEQERGVEALRALLTDRQRLLGEDHPDTKMTRFNLLGLAGSEAETLRAFVELQGLDHPESLPVRRALAITHAEEVSQLEGHRLLEEVLADQLRVMGPDDPGTLQTRVDLANLTFAVGDVVEAVDRYSNVVAERSRLDGPDDLETVLARRDLALVRAELLDPVSGLRELEQALVEVEQACGTEDQETFDARRAVANQRGYAGDLSRASTELEAIFNEQAALFGPQDESVLQTYAFWQAWQEAERDQRRTPLVRLLLRGGRGLRLAGSGLLARLRRAQNSWRSTGR